MPKRTDIKSILIIGAGPIVIGQACEFDYSGTQACKALKSEGYKIILVNSNPATIMTDPDTADATYIEPITPEIVAEIIRKERPDAILPTVGGQTALNCALALHERGVLKEYNVEMIGATPHAIEKAENRELFKQAMAKIGLAVPPNAVVHSFEEAMKVLPDIGLPAIIRPSFTLGGSGGGVAYTEEEYREIVTTGLAASPTNEILIDKSIIGWKEYEMEVVRDKNDNAIIICSIENIDPMGVHTGDSITVAPALTLTDKEYQIMRDASLAVLREIGVETGGSNVQFAVNPENGDLVVIEMNPRVSRSSALASKATGFPIAKVAAKLAVGYTLDEIQNDITKVTPASFEPTIDYVVTKIPRFTFEKFTGTKPILSSTMRSVGEVMAIGSNFCESIQKALRSMETGLTGFDEVKIEGVNEKTTKEEVFAILRKELDKLSYNRMLLIAEAMRCGMSLKEIQEITKYNEWFLEQIYKIISTEQKIKSYIKDGHNFEHALENTEKDFSINLKKLGFSNKRLAKLCNVAEKDITKYLAKNNIYPVYKRVDSCAAEFRSETPYMYSTYLGNKLNPAICESNPTDKEKVIILGGGPNRIGQGIEFDYACVHAAFALSDAGYETIMVNCNPETVSTDYDTSDRLYFEPLTEEDILNIVRTENKDGKLKGVIVQFGGQTPLKLCKALEENNVPIIGTSPDKIDLAEDRERFKALLNKLELKQPENTICHKISEIEKAVGEIGYPVVIRPSYVLGGRAMKIIYDKDGLDDYLKEFADLLTDGAILIDRFLKDAIEVDVDALADQDGEVFVAGIMEHIEEAGIHSGDSACSLPPYSLGREMILAIKEATIKLAKELEVIGLMNVQFAIKDDQIFVLEVNPRSSRTVPFVAKATGNPIAKIASLLMVGKKLSEFNLVEKYITSHIAVKEAVFPFARFPGADTILGPEMKSTGEVMGIDKNFPIAFIKSQIAAGNKIPTSGNVFISVKDDDKKYLLPIVENLTKNGFNIYTTKGTAEYLKSKNFDHIKVVNKVGEGSPHIVDMIENKEIHLVINTTEGAKSIQDSFSIRRTTLMKNIMYSTTIAGAKALVSGIAELKSSGNLDVKSIQEYSYRD